MDNIIALHEDLRERKYKHGGYEAFNVYDPKPRNINKATVRDRLLHHAIYRVLYPFFDKVFIADSFSCRLNKGTRKAINRFREFTQKISQNNTKTCWILKCDVKKFFASINHKILMRILVKYIFDDDFVIFSEDKTWLESLIPKIRDFLKNKLRLDLHPEKVFIKTLASGVDFLGWIHFPDHRALRTSTKRRIIRRLKENNMPETLNSYLGLLKHGNTYKIKCRILSENL